MAAETYVGVGGTPRKLSKCYVGAGGAARSVQEIYVGVGGAPRLAWSANRLVDVFRMVRTTSTNADNIPYTACNLEPDSLALIDQFNFVGDRRWQNETGGGVKYLISRTDKNSETITLARFDPNSYAQLYIYPTKLPGILQYYTSDCICEQFGNYLYYSGMATASEYLYRLDLNTLGVAATTTLAPCQGLRTLGAVFTNAQQIYSSRSIATDVGSALRVYRVEGFAANGTTPTVLAFQQAVTSDAGEVMAANSRFILNAQAYAGSEHLSGPVIHKYDVVTYAAISLNTHTAARPWSLFSFKKL